MIEGLSQVEVATSGALETHRRTRWLVAAGVLVAVRALLATPFQAPGRVDPRQFERQAQGQRLEGQAMLALADAAMGRKRATAPSDFRIRWQNEFLKAQQGTFVPFTLLIDATRELPESALVYVRAVRRGDAAGAKRPDSRDRGSRDGDTQYPVDAIFPVDLKPSATGGTASISRGFSISPGEYDVYVVVRERTSEAGSKSTPRAGVLTQPLSVPDFWGTELTTSSVMLADRLTVLNAPIAADELIERPYVIGQNEITPAVDHSFRRGEELVVVFLVYNPTVTADKRFDIRVDYDFFRRGAGGKGKSEEGTGTGSHPPARDGERYFNHTDPQRFNPAIMGTQFDPGAGQPVLAGQGVPLAGFEPGDYRLAIRVTDLISGRVVTRDVTFTVGS
jgi:hypothetical protein